MTVMDFNPQLDLELKREVAVPPRLVWRAWTEPELLMKWFTPAPWRTTACEIDLRPGGKFRTVMEGPNGERNDSTGCFLAVERERRLVFTDALGPGFRPTGGGFMTASVTIEPAAGGTLYTAVAFHKDEAAKTQHEEMGFHHGWGAALDQLVALVKGL
ncbi:SRPBCC family protein [Azospirillum sp. TSA6c]|uniref:SRPBCC family protein n=1 Tax=unclassified Azospirillum TaxID=2630922 RepID=UPI000D622A2F|nr:SRPBCC family protein [Azospirillum sp. TSA6c]PWC47192.1 polyketide cyclase [Azospirillum sp. TSA6c]